ncbi:hypothetical protein [Mycobacterium ahvazicum]|uniref:hypothetical protein n=1 Tax=Mycobacterium ahvazicum TaxID=1964395 RepID=UPI000BB7019B|nr:hypothetical protein [Mycobacterium ahvazicum]
MPWRVEIQVPVANQFQIQKQLGAIREMNPLHEAAGGAMRTFTLTVSDEDAEAAIGEYALRRLTEAVDTDGPGTVFGVTAE